MKMDAVKASLRAEKQTIFPCLPETHSSTPAHNSHLQGPLHRAHQPYILLLTWPDLSHHWSRNQGSDHSNGINDNNNPEIARPLTEKKQKKHLLIEHHMCGTPLGGKVPEGFQSTKEGTCQGENSWPHTPTVLLGPVKMLQYWACDVSLESRMLALASATSTVMKGSMYSWKPLQYSGSVWVFCTEEHYKLKVVSSFFFFSFFFFFLIIFPCAFWSTEQSHHRLGNTLQRAGTWVCPEHLSDQSFRSESTSNSVQHFGLHGNKSNQESSG